MLDSKQLLRSGVKSIKLYQHRIALATNDNLETSINFFKTTSYAADFTNFITYNNFQTTSTHIGAGISFSDRATGWVVYDLTSIFNSSYYSGNFLGVYLQSNSTIATHDSMERSIELAPYLEIETEPISAESPSYLLPNIVQNPNGQIAFSWMHNPAVGEVFPDPQTGWKLSYWQDGVAPISVTKYDISNAYTLPQNTFTDYKTVYFSVQTITQYNGLSKLASAQFELGKTPPLQSILIYPLNISVTGTNGVLLEWRYNSPHDTKPSKFDIRYRTITGGLIGAWSAKINAGQLSIMTDPILTQEKIEWQVKAYGELGDAGEWSDSAIFFTIGIPPKPTIVKVSNSNKPTVYFSAGSLMSWELEILQKDTLVYETGNQAFLGDFSHTVIRLIENGNYIVRMRITNEYGLTSDWSMHAFTIDIPKPNPLILKIVDNPSFSVRLYFNNSNESVYIYRSELRKNKYLRIAKTNKNVFDDFTVRPKEKYEYFVRLVTAQSSFSDSNIVIGGVNFLQTTIAPSDDYKDMLMLLCAVGEKPRKEISFDFEKTLTQFIGREKPVLQIGEHSQKSISFSFNCSLKEYEKLEYLHRSSNSKSNILLLRDWRVGAVYGTINGAISARRANTGCDISFVFTQTDFNEEVEMI